MDALRRTLPAGSGSVLALGLNVWALGGLLPSLFVPGARGLALLTVAPLALGVGIVRRSAVALILVVPLAALLLLAWPEMEGVRQHRLGFVGLAAALTLYLAVALRWLASDAPLAAGRQLAATAPEEVAVVRSRYVYGAFALTAAGVPIGLLGWLELRRDTAVALAAAHGANAELAQTLLTAFVGLVGAALFGLLLAPALGAHLDGDPRLWRRLAASRAAARAGRPRPVFFIAVALSVVLVAAVILLEVAR